jgi:hypothetical protein
VHDPRLPRREWLGWATTDRDGRPHLVPYSALDRKQKRSSKLRRIGNALARLDLTILVDHYEEDWGRIWWIRLRGRARVPTAARSETALSHSCRRSIRVPHKLTIRSTPGRSNPRGQDTAPFAGMLARSLLRSRWGCAVRARLRRDG